MFFESEILNIFIGSLVVVALAYLAYWMSRSAEPGVPGSSGRYGSGQPQWHPDSKRQDHRVNGGKGRGDLADQVSLVSRLELLESRVRAQEDKAWSVASGTPGLSIQTDEISRGLSGLSQELRRIIDAFHPSPRLETDIKEMAERFTRLENDVLGTGPNRIGKQEVMDRLSALEQNIHTYIDQRLDTPAPQPAGKSWPARWFSTLSNNNSDAPLLASVEGACQALLAVDRGDQNYPRLSQLLLLEVGRQLGRIDSSPLTSVQEEVNAWLAVNGIGSRVFVPVVGGGFDSSTQQVDSTVSPSLTTGSIQQTRCWGLMDSRGVVTDKARVVLG